MKKVLTIAGSDCSGGAGIQADLKTMLANGVYGMSVITAITAQNTTGVTGVEEISLDIIAAQLEAVFNDIFPEAVKIGMISSPAAVSLVATKLHEHRATNIVVDPVMVATSGARLVPLEAIQCLTEELFPLASVITPNLPELELLADLPVTTRDEMVRAAQKLQQKYHVNVLAKGGHLPYTADDVLVHDGGVQWYSAAHITNPNTHGTGCTLSSALAANLAKGYSLVEAIGRAKDYLTTAIAAGLNLGQGRGPLDHGTCLSGKFYK